jgi:epoxyqueuosine reductase
VLYAIGNSNSPELARHARALLEDEDAAVRDAARWALSRL